MSHDFPDGPDYDPQVVEDDPWDEPPELCPHCGHPRHTATKTCGGIAWGEISPSEATDDDLSPEAA